MSRVGPRSVQKKKKQASGKNLNSSPERERQCEDNPPTSEPESVAAIRLSFPFSLHRKGCA